MICFAAVNLKKRKKIKERKRTVLKVAKELCDTKATTLPGAETGPDNTVKVNTKRVKKQKKQKSFRDSGPLTEVPSLVAAVTTNESKHSDIVTATDHASHAKHHPAKSDRHSGVVRIIEKSRHKRVQRTDNIEEALHLDVGIGSCQW